jgi:four helix bundle protein
MATSRPKQDICERTFAFGCQVVQLCERLIERGATGAMLARQLASAGTSIGANVEEAQAGQTKPDFIAKTCIALKEAREAHYWLRLTEATTTPVPKDLAPPLQEAQQLVAILTAIILKARSSPRRGA